MVRRAYGGMGRLTLSDILSAQKAAGAQRSADGNAVKEGCSEQDLKSTKPWAMSTGMRKIFPFLNKKMLGVTHTVAHFKQAATDTVV